MPKFSVMTFMYMGYCQRGELTHRQLLQLIAENGGTGVEAFHRNFVETPKLLPEYRQIMADNGLEMAAVDVMCNLVYDSAKTRQQNMDEFRRGLDVCLELGSKIAHVAGARLLEGISPQDGRKMIAEGLMEQADFAEKNGMTLAIEDFDPAPDLICTAADCLEIIQLTDGRVKMVFDTGNFLAVNEWADANLPYCYNHINLCHFKDFLMDEGKPETRRGTFFGQGLIPNKRVAAMLNERGYDGWVSLESYIQPNNSPADTISRELPILRSFFQI